MPITDPSQETSAERAMRMAEAMAVIVRRFGRIERHDLHIAGFTPADLDSLGDRARAAFARKYPDLARQAAAADA